jgi:hypothetical protein
MQEPNNKTKSRLETELAILHNSIQELNKNLDILLSRTSILRPNVPVVIIDDIRSKIDMVDEMTYHLNAALEVLDV